MKKTDNITLFFESYSILQVLCLWKRIRRADRILFYGRDYVVAEMNRYRKKIIHRLIRFFNPDAKVSQVSEAGVSSVIWDLNGDIVDYIDNHSDHIQSLNSCQMGEALLKDKRIKQFFQMRCAYAFPYCNAFRALSEKMQNQYKSVFIVPKGKVKWFVPWGQNSEVDSQLSGTINLSLVNRFRFCVLKLIMSVAILLFPLLFIVRRFRNIRIANIKPGRYKVKLPLLWGFNEQDEIGGIKRPHNDGYLYCGEIQNGDIVHVFTSWKFSKKESRRIKDYMDKRDMAWASETDFNIDFDCLKRFVIHSAVILKSYVISIFFIKEPLIAMDASLRMLHEIFLREIEFSNIDYQVEFSRDDFNAKNVIDTIMCNRENKKTIGIQHAAMPKISPYMCYLLFDKYIIYGEIFVKLFAPHWNQLNLEKTGRENLDWVVDIIDNDNYIGSLKQTMADNYPDRQFAAVIILPTGSSRNRIEVWDELYHSLKDFDNSDLDCNVFLRFRSEKDFVTYPHLVRFKELEKKSKKIHIDHKLFSTYELIALSDVMIANSASFAVHEACAARTKIFTLDFIGFTKDYFQNYGQDMILYDRKGINKVFQGLNSGFKGFDCDWLRLKDECNYFYDGKNHQRIQQVVVKALAENESRLQAENVIECYN